MSCAFFKCLLVLASDFQFGSLRLFSSKARSGLPLGEDGRTVVDGKAGLNVFDRCVSEAETVVDVF